MGPACGYWRNTGHPHRWKDAVTCVAPVVMVEGCYLVPCRLSFEWGPICMCLNPFVCSLAGMGGLLATTVAFAATATARIA